MSKLSKREKISIFVSFLLFISGVLLSCFLRDAAWLGRFGALIVMTGVIFAFSDLPEQFESSDRQLLRLRAESRIIKEIEKYEEEHFEIDNETEKSIRNKHTPSSFELEIKSKIRKKRFYLIEATIICVGTFINGFGQYILEKIIA